MQVIIAVDLAKLQSYGKINVCQALLTAAVLHQKYDEVRGRGGGEFATRIGSSYLVSTTKRFQTHVKFKPKL